ncbi:hypothetical protein [Streptomyces rimosus]|uniref:hypothetical protein n=1 Tax=Streptomyces rimosus TaxID=1927 RepID=UPI000A7E1E61|nr:hypothetical protein [Streptomyces rimosus]
MNAMHAGTAPGLDDLVIEELNHDLAVSDASVCFCEVGLLTVAPGADSGIAL